MLQCTAMHMFGCRLLTTAVFEKRSVSLCSRVFNEGRTSIQGIIEFCSSKNDEGLPILRTCCGAAIITIVPWKSSATYSESMLTSTDLFVDLMLRHSCDAHSLPDKGPNRCQKA